MRRPRVFLNSSRTACGLALIVLGLLGIASPNRAAAQSVPDPAAVARSLNRYHNGLVRVRTTEDSAWQRGRVLWVGGSEFGLGDRSHQVEIQFESVRGLQVNRFSDHLFLRKTISLAGGVAGAVLVTTSAPRSAWGAGALLLPAGFVGGVLATVVAQLAWVATRPEWRTIALDSLR